MLKEGYLYYIYCLIDPRDNMPFYVGKGKRITGKKIERYLCHVRYAKRGINLKNPKKYNKIVSILNSGFDDVKYEFLYYTNDNVLINQKEIEYISIYKKLNPNLSNIARGGVGGKTTEISPMKGKKFTDEAKYKMKIAKLGKPSNRKGATHTKEAKQILRDKRMKQVDLNMIYLTSEQKDEIYQLRLNGLSRRKIAKIVGFGASIVQRVLKKDYSISC